jgi:adenylate cyclase
LTLSKGIREILVAAATAAALLALLDFTNWLPLRSLETATLDLRFRLRGVAPPGDEASVVLIDDRAVDKFGGWPLSHRFFAQAVTKLHDAGAKVIVLDLLFAQAERTLSPTQRTAVGDAAAALPENDTSLQQTLRTLATDDPDTEFADAIRNAGNVYLPMAFYFTGNAEQAPDFVSDAGYQRFAKTTERPVFTLEPVSVLAPLRPWAEAAAGLGHVSLAYDRDTVPRYDHVALPFQGDFIPSLPVRVAAAYLGVPWSQVALGLGEGVDIGSLHVPTDRAMRILINYRGPIHTLPTYSFLDLLDGKIPAKALEGRIVLIGASFLGIPDSQPSPFGSTPLPGTERLATIVDTMLQQHFIAESPGLWPIVVIALVLILAMLNGAMAAYLHMGLAAALGLTLIVGWCLGAQLAFVSGLWLPVVNPLIALTGSAGVALLYRYRILDADSRMVEDAFRHYLSPDMVESLARNPKGLHLGGETRALTVLFSDIRGFTSIAEGFKSNPQGLTQLINNSFLSPMTDLIMERRGTIDKYMGDCVMAFWNAPLDNPAHADDACESALAMVRELERINRDIREAHGGTVPEIKIGIGINTGDCVVGNMGSNRRFAYTAIGDAVNLASRLEGQTKTYHADIIMGNETRKALGEWAIIELDYIAVKGKLEAEGIYALVGDRAFSQTPEFRRLAAQHEALLRSYRNQDWSSATAVLGRCRRSGIKLPGADLPALYDLYESRIAYFQEHPPGPSWDTVFVAETK